MEIIMSNEEIRAKIEEYQLELQKAILSGYANFELNQEIAKTKDKINALRQQCSHTSMDGKFATPFNGRCPYCGKKI